MFALLFGFCMMASTVSSQLEENTFLTSENNMENSMIKNTITAPETEYDIVFISDGYQNLNLAHTSNTWYGVTIYNWDWTDYKKRGQPRLELFILEMTRNMSLGTVTKAIKNIREANPWSFLIVIVKTIRQETDVKSMLLVNRFFDTYVIAKIGDRYLAYEICAYCNAGNHIFQETNKWSPRKGWYEPLILRSSFKGSFFGYNLKVGCIPLGVAMNEHPQPDGSMEYSGREWNMMQYCAQKFNFTVTIMGPVDQEFGRRVDNPDGTIHYTGVVGDVKSGRVDMGACLISPTLVRREAVDNINVFYIDPAKVLSIKPGTNPSWKSILKCFSNEIWAGFGAFLVITSLVAWIVMYNTDEGLINNFLYMVSIFCWEDIPDAYKKHTKIRVLLGAWMLTCLVLGAAYSGALLSQILTPVYDRLPIETVDETIEVWMTFKGSYLTRLFDHIPGAPDKLVEQTDLQVMMDIVQANPLDHVVLGIQSHSESAANKYYQNEYREHPFYQSKLSLYPDIHSWLVPKGAIYQKALDEAVLDLISVGFLISFDNILVEDDKRIGREKYKHLKPVTRPLVTQLTIAHIQGAINILGLGYVFGTLIFIGEVFGRKIKILFKKKVDLNPPEAWKKSFY